METDEEKSTQYFKQCMYLLNNIKNNNIVENNLLDVFDETETECNKYLSKVIEKNIEKPLLINFKNDKNNELFKIIDTGDINTLKTYKFGELKYNIYNKQGLTTLHYAIKSGDTSFIKY